MPWAGLGESGQQSLPIASNNEERCPFERQRQIRVASRRNHFTRNGSGVLTAFGTVQSGIRNHCRRIDGCARAVIAGGYRE